MEGVLHAGGTRAQEAENPVNGREKGAMMNPFWVGFFTGLCLTPLIVVIGMGFLALGIGLRKGRL